MTASTSAGYIVATLCHTGPIKHVVYSHFNFRYSLHRYNRNYDNYPQTKVYIQ